MPEIDLDAIEARLAVIRDADNDADWGLAIVQQQVDIPALVAAVRRLRAEVDGLKHTQTVGTATMLGPWSTREAPRQAPRGGRRGPA